MQFPNFSKIMRQAYLTDKVRNNASTPICKKKLRQEGARKGVGKDSQ
jgi:hypothetical protein